MEGSNVFNPIIIQGDDEGHPSPIGEVINRVRNIFSEHNETVTEYFWRGFWMSREQVILEIREAVLNELIKAEVLEVTEKYGERIWMDIEKPVAEESFRRKYVNTLRLNRLTMRNLNRLREREVVVIGM